MNQRADVIDVRLASYGLIFSKSSIYLLWKILAGGENYRRAITLKAWPSATAM